MAFAAFSRYPARRAVVAALFACATLPALAGTEPAEGSWATEARVDRLLWELVNDERYSQLQVAKNYERLRARFLEQACLVSAAPCLQRGEVQKNAHTITAEITPEQEVLVEQLLYTIRSASASIAERPVHLLVSISE
jgi:endonuclease/exonuclease/phosphatase (EEP) superfamily protein YafD